MDSYQEVDLERMREQWLVSLTQRQEYLDQQLQKIVSKPDRSEDDVERESQLLECRLTLTEERNAVLVPSAGSGIPGAPVERVPVPGMETHIPVLFLDLSADDFQSSLSAPLAGGLDALLSGEDEDDFFELHIVKHYNPEVKVEASWDSTVHDCPQLSRVTSVDQRVYLTVCTVVQLSHPAHMQLVLRKRICVNVAGRQGFAQSLLKRMSQRSTIPGCGVTFEVVSNIPGDIHGPEDREMLARLAASAEDDQSAGSEEVIEKYLRSVLAVENILTLDRLRQEVAVREQLAVKGKAVRRCLSSPSINQISTSSLELFSSDLDSFKGWGSHQDLSVVPPPSRRTLPSSVSQTLNPEAAHSGFASSYLPPVKAVPKMLKSLLTGVKEEDRDQPAVHQQSLPLIMVQSASVEDNMDKNQQLVPIAAIIPADQEAEILRSVPFPPPIILDTEDFSPSSVSDTSSGYMSTSISTVTLSDVYTLSWDLPVSSSSRGGAFQTVPDDDDDDDDDGEERKKIKELSLDQSEPQESVIGLKEEAAERTDQKPAKALNHPEKSPSVHLKEEEELDPCPGDQTKENHDNSTEDPQVDGTTKSVLHGDGVLDAVPQPKSDHTASDRTHKPAPELNGVSALQISPNKLWSCDTSDPVSTSVLPSVTDEAQQIAPPDSSTAAAPLLKLQPPKSASSAANPFKIQKVKSSDLKSFQRMVGEEGGKTATGDRASSLGSGLNLSVPMESLEMISDSEEADEGASAVLPDWLKEGEFVTVGSNKSGTVRYVGPTDFAAGTWVGVELEVPAGKNDGSVGGKHYFHCNPGYGVLVRPNRVARGGAKRRRQQQKRQSANLSGSSPNLAALTALAKGETGSAGRSKGENRKSWNP